MQNVRVAVIGAGAMAREHVRAFKDVPGVELTGIFSRTQAKADALAAEFGIPRVSTSVNDLYQSTQADIVLVTVFETSMKAIALECLKHPWSLFLEKPPGMNCVEAEEIARIARAKRQAVYVGLNRRFLSSSSTALEDLETLDGPRFISVCDQQSLDLARSIGHPEVVVDNWMYANSIHLVDYIRFFGRGNVRSVDVVEPWNPTAPNVVIAKVSFDSGDLGLYQGIWSGPGPWAVTVTNSHRRWEMRPLEQASRQNAGERRLEPAPVHSWDTQFKPGFRQQAEAVVDALRGRPSRIPTLEHALDTMRMIEAIYTPRAAEARLTKEKAA